MRARARAEVGSDFARLKDEIIAVISQALTSAGHGAKDKATHVYGAARQRGTQAVKGLQGSVAANPLTSLAIAAGVGMLFGMVCRRRRGSRERRSEDSGS